jgi:cytochrome c biogenesis protein CcmG, thiol:disulfide interchange protein DsbE
LKRFGPWVAFGLLVGSLAWSLLRPHAPAAGRRGQPMPVLSVQDLSGQPRRLDAWAGRVTVVNVWASWCPPCLAEMPSLQRLHEQLGPEGLVVLGLSVDEHALEAQEIVRTTRVGYPNLHDPDGRRVLELLEIQGLPTTFVVDREGVVVDVFAGIAEYDTPEALDHFRRLLRR